MIRVCEWLLTYYKEAELQKRYGHVRVNIVKIDMCIDVFVKVSELLPFFDYTKLAEKSSYKDLN